MKPRIIELSYPIGERETPVLDHFPKVAFNPIHRIKSGNLANSTQFCTPTHVGTHVDAPTHFIEGSMTIDQIPIEQFIFNNPFLLNLPKVDFEDILPSEIERIGEKLKEIDLLMIYTGFSKHRASEPRRYHLEAPGLSVSTANFLINEVPQLKGIMVDLLSVENLTNGRKRGFPVHKILLGGPKKHPVLIEDVNLSVLEGKNPIEVIAPPLRLIGLDGAPAVVLARID